MKKNRVVIVMVMILAICLVCGACRKKKPIEEPAQNASEAVDSNKGSDVSGEVKEEVKSGEEAKADEEPSDVNDEDFDDEIDESFSEDMLTGVWSSLVRDYGFEVLGDGSFKIIAADEDDEEDGEAIIEDLNVEFAFYEGGVSTLRVIDYDRLMTYSGEMFVKEGADVSFYNNTGVITISWTALAGGEAPALCTSLYDCHGCDLFITADDLDDDGSRRIVYQVPGYFYPENLVITGNDLETINFVMSEIDLTIEMSRNDENGEEDYYAVGKDSLEDCYVRWDTGVWGYNIPVEWDGFYLAELQAD